MNENSSKKAKSSFFWSAVEKFSIQGIGFIINIIISRLVTPADYGLIAMLAIFIVVAQVFVDSGLSNYLIQNQNRDENDYDTVFYLNIGIGVICYILLFVSAPLIANFYNQEILTPILRIYAFIIIINSLTLVQRAIIFNNNQYRKLSFINISTIIISGVVGIYLGYKNWGVWALIVYYLLQSSTSGLLLWITSSWRPTLSFNNHSAKNAIDFGSKLLGANIINSIVSNLYTLAIGKKYNATDLGYYGRGQSISYIYPSNISNIISQAVFPVLCEIQNDDKELQRIFLRYIEVTSLISFLPLALLASLAEPIINLILGSSWLPAASYLRILAIAYMFDPIMRLNAVALNVKGQTSYSLKAEVLKKLALITLLYITLQLGIRWIAIGVIIYSIIDLIIVSFFVNKVISITFIKELQTFTPMLLLSILLMVIVYLIQKEISSLILVFTLSITICIIFFVIGTSLCKINIFNILQSGNDK